MKVGVRNSTAGCIHSILGNCIGAETSAPLSSNRLWNWCHSASGRSKTRSFSFNNAPSSGSRLLHSITGVEISAKMKAMTAQTAVTISTAASGRGMRRRSR